MDASEPGIGRVRRRPGARAAMNCHPRCSSLPTAPLRMQFTSSIKGAYGCPCLVMDFDSVSRGNNSCTQGRHPDESNGHGIRTNPWPRPVNNVYILPCFWCTCLERYPRNPSNGDSMISARRRSGTLCNVSDHAPFADLVAPSCLLPITYS